MVSEGFYKCTTRGHYCDIPAEWQQYSKTLLLLTSCNFLQYKLIMKISMNKDIRKSDLPNTTTLMKINKVCSVQRLCIMRFDLTLPSHLCFEGRQRLVNHYNCDPLPPNEA